MAASGASAAGDSPSLSNASGVGILVLVLVLGVVVVLGVMRWKKSPSSAGSTAGVGFENPLYASGEDSVVDAEPENDSGGYMDVGVNDDY